MAGYFTIRGTMKVGRGCSTSWMDRAGAGVALDPGSSQGLDISGLSGTVSSARPHLRAPGLKPTAHPVFPLHPEAWVSWRA